MNTNLLNDELFVEDPQVNELLTKIKGLSQTELLTDILRHEKEVRGIDWAQMFEDQSLSPLQIKEKANVQAKAYLRKLQGDLQLADEDLPDFTRQFLERPFSSSDDVQTMPAWAIDEKEAAQWKAASGDTLSGMISHRLKVMQVLEITSSPSGYATMMLSIGVIAWMKKAYNLYKIARLAGVARAASVLQALRGVTIEATRMFVATVIVAVIAEIILFLMEKEAVVYMVLLNMTDEDLKKKGQYLTHGKQMVQFINPLDEKLNDETLLKRDVIEDVKLNIREESYWIGLYVAQKKDMALYGSQGAFYLEKNKAFPKGVFVGWEITLTGVFGGPNRCLVSATYDRTTGDFSNETDRHGGLACESRTATAKVTGKMHSGSGSKGYMSVIFENLS